MPVPKNTLPNPTRPAFELDSQSGDRSVQPALRFAQLPALYPIMMLTVGGGDAMKVAVLTETTVKIRELGLTS